MQKSLQFVFKKVTTKHRFNYEPLKMRAKNASSLRKNNLFESLMSVIVILCDY